MTDHNQGAFEAALRSDLAAERQRNAVLTDQLRAANILNEGLAYKLDFMHQEVARVTASREQYERVGIRASAMLEGGTSMMIKLLQDLQEEIRAAAFTSPPGVVETPPAAPAEAEKPVSEIEGADFAPPIPSLEDIETALEDKILRGTGVRRVPSSQDIAAAQIGRAFGAGFESASLLPAHRFGNGAVK